MADVMLMGSGGGSNGGAVTTTVVSDRGNMAKSSSSGNVGVKTLSIIDTISELATDKTEASRLTLPSPLRLISSQHNNSHAYPGVPPRVPKVSVPLGSPQNGFAGAKPRFLSSSPANKKVNPNAVLSPSKMNLSAIVQVNGSSSVTSRSQRGQTPDWIRDIFHHAKRGQREKLEMATRGLESTLIRNLTDHMGNNLLHCACSAGHTLLLPFLTSRFANELSGALNDENRKGLTPVQAAIKLGRLECVQWLVRHSSLRDKLTSRDGERSLLHQAAKYGQSDLVSWLAEEMSHQGLDVDQLDIAANSPLHLAAKHGATTAASVLLHHGAQITLKNDMGLKPHDCAKVMGQKECSEFLLLYETSLDMAKELSEVHIKREALMAEHNELRSYFKDVLTIGKRLAREREEMCRELRRLHESTLELHDKMMLEMQQPSRLNNGKNQDILQACNAWHEKWTHHSRQWFGHNEAEHKLWIAEESWRQVKASSGPSSLQDQTYPQRHLRDRLQDMRGRSLALPTTTGLAALASSDDEDTNTKEEEMISNDYEDLEQTKANSSSLATSDNSFHQRRILANIAQRKKLATPAPSTKDHETNSRSSLVDESLYSSVSNEVYTKISDNVTASVIEVIEPTASEEEEFKQALKEMNWTGPTSPMPISPILHSARPVQVRSPSNSSKASPRDSIRSRYSSNGELSPTKRLMEMGIQEGVLRQSSPSPRKPSTNFLQKIASKTKLIKRSPPLHAGMYANLDHDLEQAAEEHILPDSFDEVNDDEIQVVSGQKSKSSVSPSSRKSASSHASRGSQDSGIGIPVQQRSNQDQNCKLEKTAAKTRGQSSAAEAEKNNNSKAWYDVPSDDETEAPEADSLASIISHRGSSDDES